MVMTASELSRLVGCSMATVSRALNNTGFVAPETREAIYRAMRKHSYVPQRAPKRSNHAKTTPTPLVHIVYHRHTPREEVWLDHGGLNVGPLNPVSERLLKQRHILGDTFWRRVIDGAVAEANAWGYKAVLQTNTNLQDPHFIADINASGKTAVLLVGEYSAGLKKLVDLCRHPLVLADLICDDSHDVVTIDNLAGISAAFEHLYALGHRKIGFVGKSDNFAFTERYAAFSLRMAAAGLPLRPEWVYEGYSYIEETTEGMKKLLSRPARPTAVICANDCVAMGTIRAAGALGISVPHQLSIVGFDDIEAAGMATPPLTTVQVPMQEIGRQSVRLLMIQVKSAPHGPHRGCRVRLVPQLIIRQSTAPPPATTARTPAQRPPKKPPGLPHSSRAPRPVPSTRK